MIPLKELLFWCYFSSFICSSVTYRRDLWSRSLEVILNERHVFHAAYLFCPCLIDYWVHCCFQEGRVRVTLLARSTEYRRILNQVEVSQAPPSLPPTLSASVPFFQALVLFPSPHSATCRPFPFFLSPHLPFMSLSVSSLLYNSPTPSAPPSHHWFTARLC